MNEEVATLQRVYRKLVQLGLHEEATSVAEQIARPDRDGNNEGGLVNAAAVAAIPEHRIQVASMSRSDTVAWGAASKTSISCRFQGEAIKDVARYFQEATGSVIKVEGDLRPTPAVHFACQSLPAEEALSRIVESCGWTFEQSGDAVVLRPAMLLPLRAERLPILR